MNLIGNLSLIIGLLAPVVGWAESSELCQSAIITDHVCKPSSPLILSAISSCEIEWKANNCDKFSADHPELVVGDKLRNCESPSACAMPPKVGERIGACIKGLKESWGDTGAFVLQFLSGEASAPTDDQIAKLDFFKKCKSAECKKEMLGPFASYFRSDEIEGNKKYLEINPEVIGAYKKSSTYKPSKVGYDNGSGETTPRDLLKNSFYEGYSSAVLYRKLLLKLKKDSKNRRMDEKFIQSWSGKEAQMPLSLDELVDEVLRKSGLDHPACFQPALVTEMNCYALFAVLDPAFALLAPGKLARLAGLTAKVEAEALVTASKGGLQAEKLTVSSQITKKAPFFEPNGRKFMDSKKIKSMSSAEKNLYQFKPSPYQYSEDIAAAEGKPVFNIAGVNSTDSLKEVKTIAGRNLDDNAGLYATGHSHVSAMRTSQMGFLERDQKLRDVLIKDNDFVSSQGLTHQAVATPLLDLMEEFEKKGTNSREFQPMETTFQGRRYRFEGRVVPEGSDTPYVYKGQEFTGATFGNSPVASGWAGDTPTGLQMSPFKNDQLASNWEYKITDLETGEQLKGDGLTPHMIHRYGFYQGGRFRMAPQQIINFFHLRP